MDDAVSDSDDTPRERPRMTDSQRHVRPWRRLLSGDASPADYESLRHEDPVRVMIEVVRAIAKERQDDQSGRDEARRRDLAELERVVNDIVETANKEQGERIAKLEVAVAPIRGFAKWALGVAAGALVAVGIFLYTRGVAEGSDKERLNRAIDDIKEVRGWLGHHDNRSNTP